MTFTRVPSARSIGRLKRRTPCSYTASIVVVGMADSPNGSGLGPIPDGSPY